MRALITRLFTLYPIIECNQFVFWRFIVLSFFQPSLSETVSWQALLITGSEN